MIKHISNMIKKSKSDDRVYRYLKLSNSMRCLLVSDKDVEKSAACMYVGVGNLYDPSHANGLAHFLEHMLFLGTKKYPQENQYSQFIIKNGGQKNAATSEDFTYYYFDVKNEAFPEAVDIFSQFFKEPLFTETATEREMNAVDSEYRKNLSEDSRRIFQLQKSIISKPGSAFNSFSTGNLETLNIPTIREDLLKFHREYYSSNIMNLVLVSKAEINVLEEIAVTNFSDVPNKNTVLPSLADKLPFDETNLGYLYKVVPNKDLKKLNVYWILPYSEDQWRSKPNSYLSHLLGHEGPNSLMSQLITEGLAIALVSSTSTRMNEFDLLHVDIGLTELGESQYETVLERLYAYINQIRKEGIQEFVFEEQKKRCVIDFDYKTKTTALAYAQPLARRLAKIEEEDIDNICWLPYAREIFDKEEIASRLNMLVPENSYTIFMSKIVEKENPDSLEKEKWYGTPYSKHKLDPAQSQKLKTILPTGDMKLGHPPRNIFLPENVVEKKKLRREDEKPALPSLISQDPKVWFKQDDSFDQPFVKINLKISTTDCNFPFTAQNQVFLVLWRFCLEEYLREIGYMASLAGISFNNILTLEYISLSVFGYNDNLINFLKEASKCLQNYTVEETFFNDIKKQQIRAYTNSLKQEPYQRLDQKMTNILLTDSYEAPELIKALQESMSFQTFLDMKSQWLRNLNTEWLIMGHLEESEAQEIVHDSLSCLSFRKISEDEVHLRRLTKIPNKTVYDYNQVNEDPANPNSAVLALFQYNLKNDITSAVNQVLFHLLKESFFHTLRTQEQLGYIVSSSVQTLKDVLHGRFMVQSNVQGPDFLIHRINEYLVSIRESKISKLEQKDVDASKIALINNLKQKDLHLGQEVARYWPEITEGDYRFNRKEEMIKAFEQVSLKQVVGYFDELFFNNTKRINIKLYSQKHREEKDKIEALQSQNEKFYTDNCNGAKFELIESAQIFRMSNMQYPRIKV